MYLYKWPDFWLPPLNLFNFPEWRFSVLSKAPYADHYKKLEPQPITVIEDWQLNYNLGNALKYISRCNLKGSKKADLQKAIWYIERELKNDEQDSLLS
jgi:hypothetical protein